jgi:hypothetical protein
MINLEMRKVKTFSHVFLNSLIPQAQYYHHLAETSFKFSLKYFLTLVVALNLVYVLVLAIKFNPFRIRGIFNSLARSAETIPQDLVITVKDGQLTTTYDRPFFLWTDIGKKKKLLAVIDEGARPEKIQEYQSYFLITGSDVVTRKNRKISIIPLANIKSKIITPATIAKVKEVLKKITSLSFLVYPVIILLLVLIYPLISLIITFFHLFLASVISLPVYYFLKKKKLSFQKVLQVSFHAATLPLSLDYSLRIFGLKSESLSLMFFSLLFIFILGGVYEAYFDGTK